MRSRRAAALSLSGLLTLVLTAGGALAQSVPTATAQLRTGEGASVGSAEFVETAEGVDITVSITNNVPPGVHGLHIHEKGDLSRSDFESAGDHFNPTGAEHGFDNPNGPHAGDLESITVAEDGTASYGYTNDRVTLSDGPTSILDSDGSALVVHEMADDYRTNDDPETGPGMSGDRIAAGIIEPSASASASASASGSATSSASATQIPETGGPALPPLAALLVAAGVVAAGVGAFLGVRHLRA